LNEGLGCQDRQIDGNAGQTQGQIQADAQQPPNAIAARHSSSNVTLKISG